MNVILGKNDRRSQESEIAREEDSLDSGHVRLLKSTWRKCASDERRKGTPLEMFLAHPTSRERQTQNRHAKISGRDQLGVCFRSGFNAIIFDASDRIGKVVIGGDPEFDGLTSAFKWVKREVLTKARAPISTLAQ